MTENRRVKTAIVGASGYSGEELLRLLLVHPGVELSVITSRQFAGQPLGQVFPRFAHYPQARGLNFVEPEPALIARGARMVFLALPHGVAAELAMPLLDAGCRIIDLSADFRLKSDAVYREFYGHPHPAPRLLERSVYGLPERYRASIQTADLVASPGCYPTSILLPVLPLVQARLVRPDAIVANSLSGVSGAGRKVELDYLFVECHESMRPYGVPKHRHLSEIEQEISNAAGQPVFIQFIPHLVPVNRGILTTLCLTPQPVLPDADARNRFNDQVAECYRDAYGHEPFVRLLSGKSLPDTKNVNGSNVIEIAWRLDARTGQLLIMSALDNLVKGAGGQAVQSFNLMNGLPETAGLL
ncbi:MAG: N-acetyl-gamma-glutamyl-phosphate reductase [Candidatus Omnitrophica bacterium]|nr:N-acetyl-gamma-glutamyl-phosphate reductase [Candidatus Omnitrophota bacterium]